MNCDTVNIGLIFSGIINIIGAVFAGIATLRAGRIDSKMDNQDEKLEVIHNTTNSVLEKTKEENKQLSEDKEQIYKDQIAKLEKELKHE